MGSADIGGAGLLTPGDDGHHTEEPTLSTLEIHGGSLSVIIFSMICPVDILIHVLFS